MEWTREKTLLLINEYRQRRGLWDMTCDEYRKKDVKQRLLNEVSEVLGGNIAIPELEKKFHTLRTQYHREISRMKRKEPYNSKWFGFKNLVFLSSPYACRSTKSRLKTELQLQDNTTTQKYVLGEVSTGSAENNNMNEEYIITPRKSHVSSRAQELEKLIEETTKDVDDMDDDEPGVEDDVDTKPKLSKEISGTYVQINEDDNEALESHTHHHQQQQHQQQHQQQQQPHHQQSIMELHHSSNTVEAVSFQANESGELHYQSASSSGNASSGNGASVHVVPTRIIKIQRRDTSNQENGYFEDQSAQHQLHPPPAKRIYFDPNTSHSTTILSTSTLAAAAQNGNGSNVLTTTAGSGVTGGTLRLPRVNAIVNTSLSPPKPASSPIPPPTLATHLRDEFSTYGEYVANEMRAINNREVLIALKHKINTAIFEANMAELQK
ncbi:box A-binding factor [Drosophila innubila]|uniref:box A-binding factor n=1 Tax=Drosophila innubila TaxID=198719 RepID=UPI00148C7BEF|nr:box A-binding factor [Drosophila innubila]XP_034484856.1 box A-binding factor [Drosophila innubila]XP_034484857.1 box A-binding factor [Drosophila innubila]